MRVGSVVEDDNLDVSYLWGWAISTYILMYLEVAER